MERKTKTITSLNMKTKLNLILFFVFTMPVLGFAEMSPMTTEEAKSVLGMSCQTPVNPDPQGWPCQHATDYGTACLRGEIHQGKCPGSAGYLCANNTPSDSYKKITEGPSVDGVCIDDPNGNCCRLVDVDCVQYKVVKCVWTITVPIICTIEVDTPLRWTVVIEGTADCLEDPNSSPARTAEGTKKFAVRCL